MGDRRPNRRGGKDVGVPSTVRRSFSRARGMARRLIPLAPCPVEGCPIGSCTPPIPASTSNCSLRCSPNPRLPFLQLRPIFRNQPIHKLLAKTAPTSLFSCHFQVQNSSRLVFRELTPIPVHGYDTTSGSFAQPASAPLPASEGALGERNAPYQTVFGDVSKIIDAARESAGDSED